MEQPDLDELIEQLETSGSEKFAAWDAELFEYVKTSPMTCLKHNFEWREKPNCDYTSLCNYISLAYEAIGAGLLVQSDERSLAPNFMTHCMLKLIPDNLPLEPLERRAEVLRDVWNLAAGLSREPLWLNRYVISQMRWSMKLRELQSILTELLIPVLSPLPTANWEGLLTPSVIDLRQTMPEFVPDRLYLAAPSVLCITSRSDQHDTLGILLQKSGNSKPLGRVGALPEHPEQFDQPSVVPGSDSITINGRSVATPLLAAPQQVLPIACGFVAAIAENSQRLWLIEAN